MMLSWCYLESDGDFKWNSTQAAGDRTWCIYVPVLYDNTIIAGLALVVTSDYEYTYSTYEQRLFRLLTAMNIMLLI